MILFLNDEGKALYDTITPAQKLKLVTKQSYNFTLDHKYHKLHISPEGIILNHTRRIGRLIADDKSWDPQELINIRNDGLPHRIQF